ncbi:unnamed protein product [Trifolium pratense]|uniref:Uncharacterized protein n=1 Tax=Trifolium pratense TaxID=57577 RepID=A0ACB0KM94_TRIPR|nr:unnamed protein product [Trifolium pratense]
MEPPQTPDANASEDVATADLPSTTKVENVEALLLLQEVQFEKFRQELANPSVSANIAKVETNSNSPKLEYEDHESDTEHYNVNTNRGRGRGKGRGRGRGKTQNAPSTGKVQCQICGKSNHDAAICWYRYEPPPSKPKGRGHNAGNTSRPLHYNPYPRPTAHLAIPQFYNTPDMDSVFTASWYPDSGASHHLTFNPNNIGYRMPYYGHDQVLMGNGQGVSINSLGHSNFYSPYDPNVQLKLNDLLHVPHISKNLLSVSKFAQDNNVFFEFHPHSCYVKSQDSKHTLLEGTVGSDGLYKFKPFKFTPPNTNVNHKVSSNPVSTLHKSPSSTFSNFSILHNNVQCNNAMSNGQLDSTFHIWHLRLGHAHNKAIQTILNMCNIPFSNKDTVIPCIPCCIGKSHRLFAPLSNTIYTTPFEVIHCDLWGPAPFVSHNGFSYYIAFVDTFTKYTWIYFLHQKSDALKAFNQFLTYIKNQFQTSIKAIQSDWGVNSGLSLHF